MHFGSGAREPGGSGKGEAEVAACANAIQPEALVKLWSQKDEEHPAVEGAFWIFHRKGRRLRSPGHLLYI